MKKSNKKVGPPSTREPEVDSREESAATVAVERPDTGGAPSPYRVVWRCSFVPREPSGADGQPGPPGDESP